MQINKRHLFKYAWKIARKGAKKFGGRIREFFSEALKMAWVSIRSLISRIKCFVFGA